jgi:hypothetical protein
MATTRAINTVINVKQHPPAFDKSNAAFAHANAAFISANNVAPQIEPAFLKANSAYASQNASGTYANSAFTHANAAFISANNVAPQIQPAFDKANAAFTSSNTKLAASGGTVNGDLAITGNLIVSGSRIDINTATVLLNDNIITINSDLPTNIPPTENAGIEINRGSSANVAVLWNETTDSWTFTNDGTNYETLGGGSAGSYANSAFIKANASYQTINTNSVLNRSEYIQANNTINFNVAITSNGQSIAGDGGGLSPFLLMGA